MHELSLCMALMSQVERIARERQAGRVERIELQLGPLSGAEAALLQSAWPLASAGTIAEGAALAITPAAVRVACSRCGEVSQARPNRLLCGSCGDYRTRLVSGDELLLSRVELSQCGVSTEQRPCA